MFLTQQDLFTALIAVAVIGTALLCIQLAVKSKQLNKLIGRKLLHVTAIATCAFSIFNFENRLLLAYIFLIFFFILLWIIRRGWMQVNKEKTYGIALFPLAFAALLFIPAFHKTNIVLAALILAVSDALAGICGEYFGKQKIHFFSEKKSWVGFAAFYSSAFIVTLLFTGIYTWAGVLFCASFALFPAITELFSYRGSDNFTVPVFTAIWALLIANTDAAALLQFWLLVFLFAAAAFFAVQKKWLTSSGAVAAVWMALLLYTTGAFKAFIAPGIFLLTGSLLSKLNKENKEKTGRTAKQVFANGITGVLFMILYKLSKQEIYLFTATASFCISMADTVSSELGVYFRGGTYNILSLKKMQPGLSGGVSMAGTLAGFLAAVILAAVVGFVYDFSLSIQIWIALAGFAGMVTDSILGSFLQAKYKTATGHITEEVNKENIIYSGYNWCNNDAVNLLSNLFVSLIFLLLIS